MSTDPFGTADLRAAVLGTWRASPARLREDANTEEDHARGYYRDRVLVDLAQNASDAAVRAGAPGRLLLRLELDEVGPLLTVANTGRPLDGAGVAALASMRASAKRDEAGLVGRFGVGFAAIRSVADEIEVRSATGSVGFSLAGTRAALAEAPPALAEEAARRGDWLPVLRLPFVSSAPPLPGYDTAVVARLRDPEALDRVLAQLDAVGDPVLLALPGLVEIVVETPDGPSRRIADAGARWFVRTERGELDPALTADRPVEERDRTAWQVTWALPRPGADPDWARVLHAPTPTDDPCTLPALLIATLPLDPTRRRVAPGPLADAVLARAAQVYAALAGQLAAQGQDALALVPTGLPAGELDGRLTALVVEALTATALLTGRDGLLPPGEAFVLDGPAGDDHGLVDALAARVPGLVRLPAGRVAAAHVLGVPVRRLADVVDELPAVRDGARELYVACESVSGVEAEALADLPVPLADGRVVRGVRGTVLVAPELLGRLDAATVRALAEWGVRVVDPTAAHPVLERLGATVADAAGLVRHPAVRSAVLDRQEDPQDEVGEVAAAVLDLVAAVLDDDPSRALPPWLGLVELPAVDGEPTPAHGLVLAGSPAHELFDARVLAAVTGSVVERYGEPVLVALGVRSAPVVVRVPDVVADPAAVDLDSDGDGALVAATLDGWGDYLVELGERLGVGAWVGDLEAVADLDAVAPDAWPQLLAALGADRGLRAALVDPVRGEHGTRAPSYTTWWLRTRAGLGLDRPFAATDGLLDGILPPVPDLLVGVDEQVRRALGGVGSADELDLGGWADVLDPLRGQVLDLTAAVQVWRALARAARTGTAGGGTARGGAAGGGLPTELPGLLGPDGAPRTRAPFGAGEGRRGDLVRVVAADVVVVPDSPMWLQRADLGPMLPCPAADAAALAGLLDLPLASELADGRIEGAGLRQAVPAQLTDIRPADQPGGSALDWVEHDVLRVDGAPVDWWVDADGVPHAVHLAGLACALAQRAGRWADHWAIEAVLADPGRADELGLDHALD
ncbi:MAG: ATP-binding protein [Actinobacteria bacterium]|nr:ATP-binding protein [Actinomycetota bacterium]